MLPSKDYKLPGGPVLRPYSERVEMVEVSQNCTCSLISVQSSGFVLTWRIAKLYGTFGSNLRDESWRDCKNAL